MHHRIQSMKFISEVVNGGVTFADNLNHHVHHRLKKCMKFTLQFIPLKRH